ncbi:ferrochelatase [Segnochrobactraceae bacterium EtOH-i3]
MPHSAVSPAPDRVGVLLVNLGSPEGTDYWSMRRYLGQFLSDRRVVETSRLLWWPLLNLVILTTRPSRSGKLYASVWNRERDEAPLKTITRAQAQALAAALPGADAPLVDWAMRYGKPSIRSRIESMQRAGVTRLLVVPLYPQYSAATTASVADDVFDALKTMRSIPAVRIAAPWYREPDAIAELARSLDGHVSRLSFEPEVVLFSYHGMPLSTRQKGDPYYDQCQETSRLLSAALGDRGLRTLTTFQSRFGPAEWLQPYTDDTVEKLAREGVKRIAVAMPGFFADCLETLEEIAEGTREKFLSAGGTSFAAIPCLNASPEAVGTLTGILRRELAGWWAPEAE